MSNHPLIGIWWDHHGQLVAFSEVPDASRAVHGICDSDFAHVDCWAKAARQLSISLDTEYFEVPRGRVMWHVKNSRSVILHGNATDSARLRAIADEFQLTNWTTETDLHYLFGDAADEIFYD